MCLYSAIAKSSQIYHRSTNIYSINIIIYSVYNVVFNVCKKNSASFYWDKTENVPATEFFFFFHLLIFWDIWTSFYGFHFVNL